MHEAMICWVRCYGLSLNLWRKECFDYVSRSFGSIIDVDDSTRASSEVEFACVKVSTAMPGFLAKEVNAQINDLNYAIR